MNTTNLSIIILKNYCQANTVMLNESFSDAQKNNEASLSQREVGGNVNIVAEYPHKKNRAVKTDCSIFEVRIKGLGRRAKRRRSGDTFENQIYFYPRNPH